MDEDIIELLMKEKLFDDHSLLYFNRDYIKKLETYELKKMYFENFICKIKNPEAQFIFYEKGNKYMNKTNLINTYEDIKLLCLVEGIKLI
jgi:hypothetical protein